MSDFFRCAAGMFAAIAPLGALAAVAAHRARGELTIIPQVALAACAVAFISLAAAAMLADSILDAIDVSAPSFQFAAGLAMAPLAARLILAGDSMHLPERLPRIAWLIPLGIPLLAGPTSVIAAISYAARFGEGDAISAAAMILALTGVLVALTTHFERIPLIYVTTAARLSGAVVLVLAVELAYDGVHSV